MRNSIWKKGKKIVPSAVYAATANLGTPTWYIGAAENVALELVLSGSSATPSLVLTVKGWDYASGTWYTLLASAALAADGRKSLLLGPDVTAVTNLAAQTLPPKKLQFVFSGSLGGGSATVSLYGRAE